MAKIVYILGAGFSQPLGLPVISNFLDRAKDQYFENEKLWAHFGDIFRQINALSRCLFSYHLDLHNIEDILSLLEMQSQVTNAGEDREKFVRFISDVIKRYTPPCGPVAYIDSDGLAFPRKDWSPYGAFVSGLLGLRFLHSEMSARVPKTYAGHIKRPNEYAVVSLNYDCVLEQCTARISEGGRAVFFRRAGGDSPGFTSSLAKLHGCVTTESIVAPTYNKSFGDPRIASEWSLAFGLLKQANHIRVIGYSLPQADSYIKYLLRAAALDNPNFQTLDVVCLDPFEDVEQRFTDFVRLPQRRFRFRSMKTQDYLKGLTEVFEEREGDLPLRSYRDIEECHGGEFS